MERLFQLFTLKYQKHAISESIANGIIAYILGIETGGTAYGEWTIEIRETDANSGEPEFRAWKCSSNEEAVDAKDFFVLTKFTKDGGAMHSAKAAFICAHKGE
ncbi:MAG: hypothetical protein IPN44_03665 [Flavobacteriales bacterium]|nr:hypothetical protein [Flavobacteriales bacterium]